MTEEVFLKKLEAELGLLKEEERKNIIRDFKEYFANGKAEGKKKPIPLCSSK
ncbi:HAAS signaling domain-containing protein [Ureibacillus sp. 179-F W5.1 NHS]|uniref:HAAS signaling domain-containing protein n=1 Tax=Ureibacillus sp. 179-F W5.1 NHS TaxID=3374297 RepID=UPI003879A58F